MRRLFVLGAALYLGPYHIFYSPRAISQSDEGRTGSVRSYQVRSGQVRTKVGGHLGGKANERFKGGGGDHPGEKPLPPLPPLGCREIFAGPENPPSHPLSNKSGLALSWNPGLRRGGGGGSLGFGTYIFLEEIVAGQAKKTPLKEIPRCVHRKKNIFRRRRRGPAHFEGNSPCARLRRAPFSPFLLIFCLCAPAARPFPPFPLDFSLGHAYLARLFSFLFFVLPAWACLRRNYFWPAQHGGGALEFEQNIRRPA